MDEFKLLEVSPEPLKTLCTTNQELFASKELEADDEGYPYATGHT